MAKRGKTGMTSTIPYGTEFYELTGLEYCELEDLLDAIPENDINAYEQVVYRFLQSKGYDVSPPAKTARVNTETDAPVHGKLARARVPLTDRREQRILKDLMQASSNIQYKEPKSAGYCLAVFLVVAVLFLLATPKRPINMPPAENAASTYIYAEKAATGANTAKESPKQAPSKPTISPTPSLKKSDSPKADSFEPLLRAIPSAPFVGQPKKGATIPELLKAKPPTGFY
jgi:hypothetical protein